MGKQAIQALNNLLEGIEVDRIGLLSLEDWKDTPLWNKAQHLLPRARSIIVMAMEVFPEVVRHLTSKAQIGEMTLRDLYDRNVEVINGLLDWQAYRIVKSPFLKKRA